jgi:hypothetical protein
MGIRPTVATLLRSRDDVRDVVELREWSAQVEGHETLVTGLDTPGLDHVIDLGVATGSLDDLKPGGILLSTVEARRLGVAVGDSVVVGLDLCPTCPNVPKEPVLCGSSWTTEDLAELLFAQVRRRFTVRPA